MRRADVAAGRGVSTVVLILLRPQVKLRTRLDGARARERWAGHLPALIEQHPRRD